MREGEGKGKTRADHVQQRGRPGTPTFKGRGVRRETHSSMRGRTTGPLRVRESEGTVTSREERATKVASGANDLRGQAASADENLDRIENQIKDRQRRRLASLT